MKTLRVENREQWRWWLEKNGKSSGEIWLIYYKKSSGKARIPYNDAVEEALCFGWIDSTVRKLDKDRYVQKFTPRRKSSHWSAPNVKRARKLIRKGRMTAAGLAVFDPARKVALRPTDLPSELEAEFQLRRVAWENFQRFPPFYRRMTSAWVASAKKQETRRNRLNRLMDFSDRNERIKFM